MPPELASQPQPARTRGGFQKPPLRAWTKRMEAAEAAEPRAAVEKAASAMSPLKRLVWLYFWLLIFEGALRKWLLPQFSDPILLIRDPVALAIYFLAHQQRIVPRHKLYRFFLFQAVAAVLLAISQHLLSGTPVAVLVYGYRTMFLHFPLIFLFPLIFSYEDVVKMGKWILILALPMACLMAYQFKSPADAWVNRTAGNTGALQITSVMGKIRPPATFSFISGSVSFFALVTAFAGYGLVARRSVYSRGLLVIAAIAIGLAVAVSGSRATILSGAIVIFASAVGALAGQRVSNAVTNSLAIVLLAVFVLGQIDLFQEGKEILTERIELAREAEAGEGGITGRFLGELITPLRRLPEIPLFGVGLGVGTNFGAARLTGKIQFLISEGEWGRVLFEMGPVFGLLFLGLRVALAVHLGRESLACARRGHLLPVVLFSACGIGLISGQISQPTSLGFIALTTGMCWSALRHFQRDEPAAPDLTARVKFIKGPRAGVS